VTKQRKPKKAIKPTWPHSDDQRAQSRPVTSIKPIRLLGRLLLASNPAEKDGTRSLTRKQIALLSGLKNAPRPWIEQAIAEAA
jgi:hypothetical protein